MDESSLKDQAVSLVLAIFFGISGDFRDRYDYNTLWEMLNTRIIQAGLQARDLQTFTQKLLTWLQAKIEVNDFNVDVPQIIASNNPDLLNYFRQQPALIVYFAKVAQKQASEKRKKEKNRDDQ